jgi:hypothetical protein
LSLPSKVQLYTRNGQYRCESIFHRLKTYAY